MMSRGATFREFRAFATSWTVAAPFSATTEAVSSPAATVVIWETTVCPWEKGLGWDTTGTDSMSIFRLPWEIATGRMETLPPTTTVPVRSLTITRATTSGLTSRSSIVEMKSTIFPSA